MRRNFLRKSLGLLVLITYLAVGITGLTKVSADEITDTETPWPTGPDIQGDGAIVIEASTGSILYEKNSHEKFYPASTTKILTTLVALENSEMNEIVTMSYAADNYVSKTSSRMGLVEGEQLTMEQALYGIMLESANEATYAVGEHVGGSIARFIKMMNAKAQSLGCTASHFANSHGLHDEDHYTCPYDLCLISRAAYQNDEFMKITGTAFYAMPETNKNEAKLLTNHHWFLNKSEPTMMYDYCIGGKTGATTQAGYALVTYARKDGMTLISVVMHSPSWNAVYSDSKKLLEYCYNNFKVYKMNDLGEQNDGFPSMFGEIAEFTEGRTKLLYTGEGGIVILPDSVLAEETSRGISFNRELQLGHGENAIGSITYTYGTRVVGAADIIYYNNETPMTDARFEELWPDFMIPVNVAFSDGLPAAAAKPAKSAQISDYIDFTKAGPVVIGVGIGALVLVFGLIVMAIVRWARK